MMKKWCAILTACICALLCSCQAELSPQELLDQQPIDETHDAFLVDTGGSLGTLLVTAELAQEVKNEFGARDVTFSVWDPADEKKPLQTIESTCMMGLKPEYHQVVDANFDGFCDFGYLYHMGNQPAYYSYWLWDEDEGRFAFCQALGRSPSPALTKSEKS